MGSLCSCVVSPVADDLRQPRGGMARVSPGPCALVSRLRFGRRLAQHSDEAASFTIGNKSTRQEQENQFGKGHHWHSALHLSSQLVGIAVAYSAFGFPTSPRFFDFAIHPSKCPIRINFGLSVTDPALSQWPDFIPLDSSDSDSDSESDNNDSDIYPDAPEFSPPLRDTLLSISPKHDGRLGCRIDAATDYRGERAASRNRDYYGPTGRSGT
ncbi:hypothetical protein N658DRAFT_184058 [Parathielavia hyrcaniae]|uniref:Uncharacterized protein n=1 Tax=Parathielavia hyrcaniae TaxID=113614 RepID=A0AAN6Q6T3_9PEZI|nr:hypothetical protein N658DRAFT_184058 [Parathielavia hyrcaniae]